MKVSSLLKTLGIAAILGMTATGCQTLIATENVSPGYVGLKIPLYGDNKGIDNAETVTGRIWYYPMTEDLVQFPTFMTTYQFTADKREGSPNNEEVSFSVAGSPVKADIGTSFYFIPDKVKDYYKTYRKDPELFRANEFRNTLRNCASLSAEKNRLTPSALSVSQQVLLKGVQECLQSKFPFLFIDSVSLLSTIRLDPAIQKSIDQQFAAQQAAKTAEADARRIQAEALAKVAQAKGEAQVTVEQAKAEAESNRLTSGSITDKLIQMKKLQIEEIRANKWNGQMANVIQTPNLQLGTNSNNK